MYSSRTNAIAIAAVALLVLAVIPWTDVWVRAEDKEYTWHVRPRRSRASLSPDCFLDRDMLLVNDQNPGEVLRASVGDKVRVTIVNHSPTEGLTMHYHGISMFNQPYSDGAAARSRCNVGPMQTAVHEFEITSRDVGTHYYHGHSSLDRGDGLQGPIVITDRTNPPPFEYDEELLLFMQDWYHRAGPSQRTGLDSSPFIWIGNADSFLFNGKGRYGDCLNESSTVFLAGNCDVNCSSAEGEGSYLPYLQVESNKTYLLRIVSAATLVAVNFAIANHSMTIVEADGTYVEPITVRTLDIGVAQRYAVLLRTDQPDDSYWIETTIRFRDGGPLGRGYLRYGSSPPPTTTNNLTQPILSHPNVSDIEAWAELDASLKTLNPGNYATASVLSSEVSKKYIVVGTQANDAEIGLLRWAVNNISQTFPASPTLYSALVALQADGAADWPETIAPSLLDLPDKPPIEFNYTENLQNQSSLISTNIQQSADVVMRLQKGNVIEIVLQNALALNGRAEFHSWHMHGRAFWVVGQGQGTFDPNTDAAAFNLENPVRRDTLSLLPYGWTAIRFEADNPGAWPFHCTMAAHAVMGMGFTILTSPELLPSPPPGLYSCMETSMNPADAQVCTSASDSNASGASRCADVARPLLGLPVSILILLLFIS